MEMITRRVYENTEELHALREHGRAVCDNTCLFPDGTIKASRDTTFRERLTAEYFYKYTDDTVYKM